MAESSGVKTLLEYRELLSELGREVKETRTRRAALEAFAKPIVDEARRIAGKTGEVFDKPTGNLAKGINSEWDFDKPNQIEIGWSAKAHYGEYLERGYLHTGKRKQRKFIKKPHLRPAYIKMRKVGSQAAIEVLRRALEGIN